MSSLSQSIEQVSSRLWDIPQSIPELAYLTHNFFRYYGKFPSILAKNLINEFALPDALVVDNYAGSGTSLVEAKLAGYNSIGVDINPLGVLASSVKCRTYSLDTLLRSWYELSHLLEEHEAFLLAPEDVILLGSKYSHEESLQIAVNHLPKSNQLNKWFTEKTQHDLALIKTCILQLPQDEYREFFTLAFCAIIRRVSLAFDGEIRPHVNKDKEPRPVWKAFSKKVKEMLEREREWIFKTAPDIWASAVLLDNRQLSTLPILNEYPVGIIIAHPPYLNSFDYIPAYSLEFEWSQGFDEIWGKHSLESVRNLEIRAWPATNPTILNGYFENQRATFREAFRVLAGGGTYCVVVGDATIHGKLIPVLSMFADIAQDIGFTLEEVIYRTTHYGVGKYAYSHRADYHDNGDGKKDGVLIFRKPK